MQGMMRRMEWILCLCSVAGVLFAQQSNLPTVKEIVLPTEIPPRGFALTKVGGGYFWTFRRMLTTEEQKTDVVQIHSSTDNSRHVIPFWIEGANTIQLRDVTVARSQAVLFVGSWWAEERDGARDVSKNETRRNFIAAENFMTHAAFQIDTGDYEPARVCGGADGSVWALGQDTRAEAGGKPYRLLRRYSMSGELLGSYLERKSIDLPVVSLEVTSQPQGQVARHVRPTRVILSCGEQSVGVYLGASQTWDEVSLSDGHEQSWTLTLPSWRAAMTGLALLGEHNVYATFRAVPSFNSSANGTTPIEEKPHPVATRSLYSLKLGSDSRGTWAEVPGTSSPMQASGSLARVVGSDGLNLICLRTREYAGQQNKRPTLVWLRP